MKDETPDPTQSSDPSLPRSPFAVLGFVCSLVAVMGAIDVIVRDFGAPQSCSSDIHRPYFTAYSAMGLGFLAINLWVIGAILARSGMLQHDRLSTVGALLGVLAIILAFGGLLFYGPLCL